MEIWFTSDHHFGHQNIIRYADRPFSSVAEMNEAMIERHNALVRPDDVVFHLGDLAMGVFSESIKCAAALNGRKLLIPGNHEKLAPFWSQKKEKRAAYEEAGYTIVALQRTFMDDDGEPLFDMCHFPFYGDHGDVIRYQALRPKFKGLPLVHGHVHTDWHTREQMFNVGVDMNGFEPVHLDTILEWADSLPDLTALL